MRILHRWLLISVPILFSLSSSWADSCPFGEMEKDWCWPTEKGGWGSFLGWHGLNSDYNGGGLHLGKDVASGDSARIGSNKVGRQVVAMADGIVIEARDDVCGYGGAVRAIEGRCFRLGKYKEGAGIIIRHTAFLEKEVREVDVLYAHLDPLESRWKKGDRIMRGQNIGTLNDYTKGKIHLHIGTRWEEEGGESHMWDGYGYQDHGFFDLLDLFKKYFPHNDEVESRIQVRYAHGSYGLVAWESSYGSCWDAPKVWMFKYDILLVPVSKYIGCGFLDDFWWDVLRMSSKQSAALLEQSKQGLLSEASEGVKDGLAYAADFLGLRQTAQAANFTKDQYFRQASTVSDAILYKDGLLKLVGTEDLSRVYGPSDIQLAEGAPVFSGHPDHLPETDHDGKLPDMVVADIWMRKKTSGENSHDEDFTVGDFHLNKILTRPC
jgi:hypothetical protein